MQQQKNKLFTAIIALLLFILFLNGYKNYSFSEGNIKLTSKDKLIEDDFQISGIKLGQSITEVLKSLGKPEKTLSGNREDEYEKYYYYKGIIIATSKTYPGKVSYIS
ncbi:MAG TPA: hypothetical protein VHY08_19835, partial [Bacillota bacterium]|nr:hypothetical protein [Bacillota bacterium]